MPKIKSGQVLPFFYLLGLCLVPLLFSGESLRKGTVIKQFTAYSISESLSANPLGIFETKLPCKPPMTWAEEPPVFHFLAGLTLRFLPGDLAQAAPLIAFFLLGIGIFALISGQIHGFMSFVCVLSILFTPAYLRYSIQHIPDVLATSFLVLGAAALLRQKRGRTLLLFTLAITTKPVVIFAVAPLLFWKLIFKKKNPRFPDVLLWGTSLCITAAPFLLWLVALKWTQIPNALTVSHPLLSRLAARAGALLDYHYYLRVFTWVAVKGVGIPIFSFFV
ncbi:MAG: hypothetical protein AABZ55_00245, partial [Bdellovibrionota bacterium]